MSPSSPDAAKFLQLRQLAKRFGDVRVLKDLSLAIDEGEILALLGPSGSGKTTVLRLLAGFETPDDGSIVVDGDDVTALRPAKRGFGMVFQHYALFPHMTVAQNVAFGLKARGWRPEAIAERVEAMLKGVDLAGFGRRKVSEISGGQQQRVALARALAPQPRVLLLDEPLSNLDPSLRERTRRELRDAVRRIGITTVLVTHEQEEAFHVGDRVAVLNGGRLEQVGRPEELYAAPASRFVATFVGRGTTLAGVVASISGDEARVRLDNGRDGTLLWSAVTTETLAAGQHVALVVRPEALGLAAAEDPDALPGRIVERRFTGALTYGLVRLTTGVEIEVLIDPDRFPSDDRVFVVRREPGPRPRVFAIGDRE